MTKRPSVDLFQIRFPRLTQKEAIDVLIEKLNQKKGAAICFPDMSTLNQAVASPTIQQLIQNRFLPLNDGAGTAFASRLLKLPFPDNLNGTDLVPKLLKSLPPKTKVFLIGSKDGVAEKTRQQFSANHPLLEFVGAHSGFFSPKDEAILIDQIGQKQPHIVLVGMGNPDQLQFIDRHRSMLPSSLWLAVGGLFDFYGSTRIRAPNWMIRWRLEWLHILWTQPYKWHRYLVGIPLFFWRTIWFWIRGKHAVS